MLAAAASYQLLRIAVVLPDMAVYGLSQIPSDPSQRLRPTYHSAPMAITHQALYKALFLPPLCTHNGRHTPGLKPREKKRGGYFLGVSAKEFSLGLTSIQTSFDLVHRDKMLTCSSECWARHCGLG